MSNGESAANDASYSEIKEQDVSQRYQQMMEGSKTAFTPTYFGTPTYFCLLVRTVSLS